VEGYACRLVGADLPGLGRVTALVVDESAGAPAGGDEEDAEIPDWVPRSWLSPVVGDSTVDDIYGAIGVWPAAFVAAEALVSWARSRLTPFHCVEVGCGAGFPSLTAARLGASVVAVDTEALPLALLEAAFRAQQHDCAAQGAALQVFCGDAMEAPLEGADAVVVSDLLYSVDLGRSLGQRLGKAARRGSRIIVTDGVRSGSDAFLESFAVAWGASAAFEDVAIPKWAPNRVDFFDGEERDSVRVLRY